MSVRPAFTAIMSDNVTEVSDLLDSEGGYLLIAWPGFDCGFTISLFYRPTLRLKQNLAILSRHRGDNANNPLDDREYRFGKAREKDALQRWFPSLDLDGYRLAIAANWSACTWINFKSGRYFYVPENNRLSEAFAYIFEHPFVPYNPPLPQDAIERMTAYMLEDLEDKAIVRKVISAGMAADVALGIN